MFLNIRLLFCCFLIHDYQHILSSIYLVFYALIKELFLPHYINFSFNIYKSNKTAKKKLFIKFLLGKDGLTEDNFCFLFDWKIFLNFEIFFEEIRELCCATFWWMSLVQRSIMFCKQIWGKLRVYDNVDSSKFEIIIGRAPKFCNFWLNFYSVLNFLHKKGTRANKIN